MAIDAESGDREEAPVDFASAGRDECDIILMGMKSKRQAWKDEERPTWALFQIFLNSAT